MKEEFAASATLDVIIIGAGISGINSAYHLQNQLPDYTYAILEARSALGGTWDFFRYPGMRSDSDLFTFGFSWRRWTELRPIADSASILTYVGTSAATERIDEKIRFNHNVVSANWSTDKQIWSLQVAVNGEIHKMYGKALVVGCGYYDYQTPLKAQIPGLESFQGQVVHPQFWPKDLDYTGKRIVIIGSGATAVTLLPNLASKAKHVTMLQRSPSYITSVPNTLKIPWWARLIPESVFFRMKRLQMIMIPIFIWFFCRWFPTRARKAFRDEAIRELGSNYPVDVHFNPYYEPWDQRVCLTPDGDFWRAITSGKASVVTDRIQRAHQTGIHVFSGQDLPADIIVTATGLKLRVGGGAKISVDGEEIHVGQKMLWRHSWMQDVPNCAFVIGYANASWTLGADTTALLFCRMLRTLRQRGLTSAVPRPSARVKPRPFFSIKSTYIQQGIQDFPLTGDVGPWTGRTNYFWDLYRARYGSIEEGLDFYRDQVVVQKAL